MITENLDGIEYKGFRNLSAAIINMAIFDYAAMTERKNFEMDKFGRMSSSTQAHFRELRKFFDSDYFEGLCALSLPDAAPEDIRKRIYSGHFDAHSGRHWFRRNSI